MRRYGSGGLWSFDSGTMQSISNQYAAMPSMHFGWALWCCLALVPVLRSLTARMLLLAYPWLTLFAIIITGNHYWLDAVGGAFALAFGFVVAAALTRLDGQLSMARLLRHSAPQPVKSNECLPPTVDDASIDATVP